MLLVFYAGIAQDTTTCYFDEQLTLTSKNKAAYQGKIVETQNGWEAFGFYPDQKILMHGFFNNKKLEVKQGPFQLYYPNGKMHMAANFTNGEIDGSFMAWHENGQVSDSGLMNNGSKTGLWNTYYESGQLQSSGRYYMSITDSIWHWYRADGTPATIELYRNGKLYDLTCFDSTGNKTGSNCRIDKKPCPENSYNFEQYVADNLFYPKEAMRKGIEGTVSFEFFVTKEGKLTRINFTNVANDLLQQEVVKLLKAIPGWEPAMSHNRAIDYLYSFEVPFYLPSNE